MPPAAYARLNTCTQTYSMHQRTSCAAYKHLDGALGAKVGLHHLVQPLGGVDVHEQGRVAAHHLRIRVERLDRPHAARFAPPLPLWPRAQPMQIRK